MQSTDAEGDVRTVVATLARELQTEAKNMDDTTIELDFASDNMGSRGRLRFRSYRHRNGAA
jgi:hypothetical protein